MSMTAEMECLERAVACVRMLKEILVAAAGVNDYPDIPGQPRADESMKAMSDIRRIVTDGRRDILGIAGISEAFFADGRRNNNQIDGTSYYRLPCGLFLEEVRRIAREAREWNPSQKTRDWYAPHAAAAKETP